jgi:hypothetical protein
MRISEIFKILWESREYEIRRFLLVKHRMVIVSPIRKMDRMGAAYGKFTVKIGITISIGRGS